jgi:hypothetical protein
VDLLLADLPEQEVREVETRLGRTEEQYRELGREYKYDIIDMIYIQFYKNARDIFTLCELRYYRSKLKYFTTLCLYDKLGKVTQFFNSGKD